MGCPRPPGTRIVGWLLALCVLSTQSAAQTLELRVGLHDAEPFAFRGEDGQATGFAVDILDHIADQRGWAIRYVDGSWSESLQRLRRGEIDLLVPILHTPERELELDFTHETMLFTWASVFTLPGARIGSFADLDGATLAVVKDDAFQLQLSNLISEAGFQCTFVELPTAREVIDTVVGEEVDACLLERFACMWHAEGAIVERVPIITPDSNLLIAARQGQHQAIIRALDSDLHALKSDQDSYYQESLNRWFVGLRDRGLPGWVKLSIAGSILLVGGLGAFSWLLKSKVRSRTEQVAERNRQLAASEMRMRLITDALPVLIASIGRDERFRFCNASAVQWFEMTPGEALGLTFVDVLGEAAFEAIREPLEQSLQGRSVSYEAELDLPDGEQRFVHAIHVPHRDGQGKVDGCHVLLADLTEQRKAEEERRRLEDRLRQTQKIEAIGQLASGIAHDFQNLLAVISAHLGDLSRLQGNGQEPGALESVHDAIDQATHLTRSLLTFAQRAEANKEPIDLRELVTRSARLLIGALPDNVTLRVEESGPGPAWIHADPNQIQQVVLNLALNARDAMPDGGKLEIKVRSSVSKSDASSPMGPLTQLIVSDTGVGITEEHLPRIFEPFYTTKGKGEGSGLGLSTVHGIVKEHGGRIEVVSRPDKGTVFSVEMPALPVGPELGVRDENGAGRPNKEILLVEDDQQVRHIVAATLSSMGYAVVQASGPREMVERYSDRLGKIRMLVVATQPGQPDVSQAITEIRDMSPALPVVLIMETDPPGAPESPSCIALDSALILRKPFSMSRLAESINNLLEVSPGSETS